MLAKRLAAPGMAATLLLLSSSLSGAYFSTPMVQDYIPDARSSGMGQAFTAVAEGPSGVWWNPGGLGLLRGWWAAPLSTRPIPVGTFGEESSVRSYGISGRVRHVGLAAHFGRLKLSEPDEPDYAEEMLLLGAGIDLAEMIRRRSDRRLQWGMGAAFERNSIHAPGAIAPEWRRMTAWDVNIGTLARLERPLDGMPIMPIAASLSAPEASYVAGRFGLMFHNALDRKIGPGDDSMGQQIRWGLGIETGLVATPPYEHLIHALVTLEIEEPLNEDVLRSNVKYGLEATLLGMVTYRYGMFDDHYVYSSGEGDVLRQVDHNQRTVTHGFGLRLGIERLALHFDYGRAFGNIYSLSVRFVPGWERT